MTISHSNLGFEVKERVLEKIRNFPSNGKRCFHLIVMLPIIKVICESQEMHHAM